MKLILAEKPSTARILAHVVGAREKIYSKIGKAFCYFGNSYYVVNARGHLYGLGEPEDYGYSKKYNIEELPMFPDFKIFPCGEDTVDLRKLISELIFRHIYEVNHCTKPVKRLWCNSMTDEVIVTGYTDMRKGIDSLAAIIQGKLSLDPYSKICSECGSEMEVIGKEFIRDELVYVPARMFVRKHYAETTRCVLCGIDESRDNENDKDIPKQVIIKAAAPNALIPGSFCSPELLAHILYSKYVQAVPLYRQEKDYAACGAKLSRQTMSNWVIWAAVNKAKPVFDIMKEKLLGQPVIHADETVLQVLHEPNKKAKTDSRMWVYCTDKSAGRYIALFDYSPTRNGDNAADFLGDYSGYLVCDGYDGYNKLQKITRCGCWAHARRKFVEALPTDKELVSTSMAAKGVNLINELYEIERSFDRLTPEEKHKQRQ